MPTVPITMQFLERNHYAMKKILIIPDTQVKPGVPMEHLNWLGQYIVDQQPDIIVHLGDHFDMPSLSSYDKGTALIEGKRISEDIAAGIEGLNLLEAPMNVLRNRQKKNKEKVYNPRKIFLLGNHEQRIQRYINANPELIGTIGYDSLCIRERGWELYDFLQIVNIEGVLFSHYFASPLSGRPIGGKAHNILQKVGKSFVQGHRQELDFTCRELCDGTQQIGIVAGAFYQHEEGYKGYQGNKHWRGVIIGHELQDGYFDPMMVSLDFLRRKYGEAK